jgi:uncharacterized membrane protein
MAEFTQTAGRAKALIFVLVALTAALMSQIVHEMTHALAMWTVGNGVEVIQLFAVKGVPVVDEGAQLVVSGSAAIVNVVFGIVAVVVFHSGLVRDKVWARLLTMYIAAYMLMTGFGYFFVDALFYAPDAPFFPDWQYVIHTLGGGWEVRLPLLVVGTVGSLGVFFWLPNSALRFVSAPTEKDVRQREMLLLALVPYLAVNGILTVLGFSHPLGVQGVVTVIFQYWFGYIALFWAYFIGGMWTDVKANFADASVIPAPTLPLWLMGLAAMWGAIAFLMLFSVGG